MNKQEIPSLLESTLDIMKSVLRGKTIDITLRNRMNSKIDEMKRVVQKSLEPQIFIRDSKGSEDRE